MSVFFKLTLIFMLLSFSLNDYQKKPNTVYNLRQIVSSYSEDRVVKNLKDFVTCCRPNKIVGSKGHDKSLEFLQSYVQNFISDETSIMVQEFKPDVDHAQMSYRDQIEKALEGGLERESDEFKKIEAFANDRIGFLEKKRETKGRNLIWSKLGTEESDQMIVIGAHYDHITYHEDGHKKIHFEAQIQGADKNASGVAVLMSMIEVLHQMELPKTVAVIFFDYGEFNSLGAKGYVDELKNMEVEDTIAGFINTMMVGHSSKISHKEKLEHDMRLYTRAGSEKKASEDRSLASRFKSYGDKMGTPLRTEIDYWELELGGQRYFQQADIPAFMLSQNWQDDPNPRIHTSNDFIETLNFKTLHASFRYLTGSVLAWSFDL